MSVLALGATSSVAASAVNVRQVHVRATVGSLPPSLPLFVPSFFPSSLLLKVRISIFASQRVWHLPTDSIILRVGIARNAGESALQAISSRVSF